MEYLQCYKSDESFEVEPVESISTPELEPRTVRSVYLITYSQANLTKFPSREAFAEEVISHFQCGKVKVLNWVCCLEDHKTHGRHYHLAVKLTTKTKIN